jgi:hypothetical protein
VSLRERNLLPDKSAYNEMNHCILREEVRAHKLPRTAWPTPTSDRRRQALVFLFFDNSFLQLYFSAIKRVHAARYEIKKAAHTHERLPSIFSTLQYIKAGRISSRLLHSDKMRVFFFLSLLLIPSRTHQSSPPLPAAFLLVFSAHGANRAAWQRYVWRKPN